MNVAFPGSRDFRTLRILRPDAMLVRDDHDSRTLLLKKRQGDWVLPPEGIVIRHQLAILGVVTREDGLWSVHPWNLTGSDQGHEPPVTVLLEHLVDLGSAGLVPRSLDQTNFTVATDGSWWCDFSNASVALRTEGFEQAQAACLAAQVEVATWINARLGSDQFSVDRRELLPWGNWLRSLNNPPAITSTQAESRTHAKLVAAPRPINTQTPLAKSETLEPLAPHPSLATLEPTEFGGLAQGFAQLVKGRLERLRTPRFMKRLVLAGIVLLISTMVFSQLLSGVSKAKPLDNSEGRAVSTTSEPLPIETASPEPAVPLADPVANAIALWDTRVRCLSERVDCDRYAQPGSAIATLDQQLLDGAAVLTLTTAVGASVVTDMGQVMLMSITTENGTASVLMVRTEAGWRFRDLIG